MDLQQESKSQTISCCNCQDENNNNFENSICSNYERKNCLEEKENERVIVAPDISSDDEYWCSSCSSINDSELISLDTRKLWQDIAHIIKCIYRETNREFAENHSTNDICKAKQYVQILTQLDAESLFNKIESIVLEYVNEIRNQVLKRFQTCLKTSNDVQLFISYFLDEYNTFIQAAKNISTIISYLEEHYMESFHLTWLLYNKHLYEKLVYMDKKIQHSMSTMIDLLQPSNDIDNDYSPAEYTQLLNRFLAFDEEMSEIACLYKDCQTKMTLVSRNSMIKKRNQMGIIVTGKKKKICKKIQTIKNTQRLTKEILNSSTTNALNIPLSNDSLTASATCQQDSNDSSIGSGVGGKESSSISSFDEYLLDNNTSSSSYTKETLDSLIQNDNNNNNLHEPLFHDILNNVSSTAQIQHEMNELKLNENIVTDNNEENKKAIKNEITKNDKEKLSKEQIVNHNILETSAKKSKSNKHSSNQRKENLTTTSNTSSSSLSKTSLTSNLILPPKPPSSTTSKLAADFRPLTSPLLNKTEIPTCPSLLSAKIQSVSFTAGTFGSITAKESVPLSSNNQKSLSINLSCKSGLSIKSDSTIAYNNLDQLLRQATSTNEISTLLSSLESSKTTDDLQKSSFNDKDSDYCCCDLFSESDSSITNGCATCMPLTTNTTLTYGFNQRDIEMKERLKIKLTKRTIENNSDQSKLSIGNKSKIKPSNNNIDDLVRFIDGNETASDEPITKKKKKKKNKQVKINPSNEDINEKKENLSTSKDSIIDSPQTLSKRKQKAKLKLEQKQKQDDESSINKLPTPSIEISSSQKTDSIQTNHDILSESSIPPETEKEEEVEEEHVNWITISRKQNKHKTMSTPVPSLSTTSVVPSNNIQQKKSTKTKNINMPTLVQSKPISETVSNSNKQQKQTTILAPPSVQNQVKNPKSQKQQQNIEPPSAWTTHEQTQVKPSSTLLATAPVFVPSSSRLFPNKVNDVLLLDNSSSSSSYLDSNSYLIPSSSLQESIPSFSPAPGPLNKTKSRCIQRPSSEPRSTSFLNYSSINNNNNISNLNSTWNDTSIINSNESQWIYSDKEKFQTSTIPNDFPLYDPFNSGAGLTLLSSTLPINDFEEHLDDLRIPQNNAVDDMDIFDKEIEDFKKFYIDNVSINPREQVQNNIDHHFIHQS
ncbi:unnamed protein product [Rotaria sordida]|uniref:Uncharacterized protein n=1 Tax=Rotaria sordida TaxID=392033 RepID=A0A814SNJ2_9BILA|nr:unnamed protein product [Rotaria sordida]